MAWAFHVATTPPSMPASKADELAPTQTHSETHRKQFLAAVLAQAAANYRQHGHEAWAPHEFEGILREEFEEVWDAIKEDAPIEDLVTEVIQLATVCLRFIETPHRGRRTGLLVLPLPCAADMTGALGELERFAGPVPKSNSDELRDRDGHVIRVGDLVTIQRAGWIKQQLTVRRRERRDIDGQLTWFALADDAKTARDSAAGKWNVSAWFRGDDLVMAYVYEGVRAGGAA